MLLSATGRKKISDQQVLLYLGNFNLILSRIMSLTIFAVCKIFCPTERNYSAIHWDVWVC